ncbi:pseudouridine-5'-phosphate glycosidase [Cetobacterium sp. 8H]|uniref:pseudouridine-5'-phosphate glycosidase n=1 Tax=Cetobacterium sp. 8H TaxID=2759681 RepID=UPI00163D2459|nr:pseudouridine-5'-phosphate glycosidase [Cetobacterium sp. 8H]MBC2851151.1 pseudouridine-5'-phosphate glycosidase [Cetobacterium sp. 8H]
MNLEKYLVISEEVKNALANNQAIVALESTIISHGMPYPQNVETALKVEEIVRENGAIPATIAILNGKLKVGLSKEEIDYLGKKGLDVTKASRRDIPAILASEGDGATTVASTMIIAALAGVKIFATGGIGGVHRGAETTMDISADLEELAMTDVAVVCAGAKSILDIGLTLEFLETKGVPVLGYQTKELPAFYTRKSGFNVDYKMDTPEQIAKTLKAKWDVNLKGGVVIANPIPEEFAMDFDTITTAINNAVAEAEEKGIKGKNSTPFLLAKVKDITKGKSLEANIELVFNNARLASKIAKHYVSL